MITFKQGIQSITTDLTNLYDVYVASKGDYTTGNKVTYKGMYYEVIPSSVPLNYYPDLYPLYWKKIGVANKESIIDLRSKTYSTKSAGFYVEFDVDYTMESLAIGYFSAYRLKVEAIAIDGTTVLRTYYNELQDINENVFDYYDYIYSDYTNVVDRTIFLNILPIGVKLRLTFEGGVGFSSPYCGFVVYGTAINCGDALNGVNFKFNSYSVKTTDEFGVMTIDKRNVQDIVDFETVIDKDEFMVTRNKIKKLYDEFLVFVLNEKRDDENAMVGIGSIQDFGQIYDEFDKSILSFSILEAI